MCTLSGPVFWCLLDIVPIKNEKREVVLFLASHKDISDTKMYAGVNRLPLPGFEQEKALAMDGGLLDPEDSDPETCDITGNHLDVEAPANYNYGRRRSRAVLYQLSGHYKTDKSKKIHSKLSTNVSANEMMAFSLGRRRNFEGLHSVYCNLVPFEALQPRGEK